MNLKSLPPIVVMTLCLCLVNPEVTAGEPLERSTIWVSADLGRGNVKTSSLSNNETTANYLALKFGYRINPYYLLGLELSGWSLEYGNLWNPNKGEAISQVLIYSQFYPLKHSGGFFKLGGGYASHWNNSPDSGKTKDGWALVFGGGYDFPLYEDWQVTPFATMSHATTDNEEHNAWALGIGIAHQF